MSLRGAKRRGKQEKRGTEKGDRQLFQKEKVACPLFLPKSKS